MSKKNFMTEISGSKAGILKYIIKILEDNNKEKEIISEVVFDENIENLIENISFKCLASGFYGNLKVLKEVLKNNFLKIINNEEDNKKVILKINKNKKEFEVLIS